MSALTLLPHPQSITFQNDALSLSDSKLIAIASPIQFFGAKRLQAAIERKFGLHWEITVDSMSLPAQDIGVRFYLEPSRDARSGYYHLDIASDHITITGNALESLWYGICTLIQIIEQSAPVLPMLSIDDWADFERRGVMLDISRDKVPTMETLYALVDRLAGWKINELQLYSEHTFAYRQHPEVWAKASPMTSEQILLLDQYCRERYIDLVPNQNSFGHMHRWLMHERYRPLAEVPEGLDWPFFLTPRPFTIAPAEPGSLELIASLYDELLPNFTSRYFNVGCDETFDLGRGRSKALVEAQGKGRVYLDYLKKIHALVQSHGRTMMFWGDIIMQYPELVPELPKDVIALEWGYEADHPFDKDGACFAAAGIKFYVCPGTSAWLSLIGRTDNALANLRNAAINGKKHGAIGFLNTEWGDYGHMQPLSASYLGFAYGAALSWAVDSNLEINLPGALDLFAFEDSAGVMGKLAYDLGCAYRLAGVPLHNSAVMFRALVTPLETVKATPWQNKETGQPAVIDPNKVRDAMAEVERLTARLDHARPADPLIVPEYRLAIALWLHGCKRLLMLREDGTDTRKAMAEELKPLMEDYCRRWLARNRPGGLDDSLVRLQRLLAEYAA